MTCQLAGPPRTATQLAIGYASLIVVAEVAIRFVGPTIGGLVHAGLLLALVSHIAFARTPKDPLLPVLAMLPVVRLAGMVVPAEGIPVAVRWALVTLPALIAVVVVVRTSPVSLSDVGLGPRPSPRWQLWVPLVGVPLGVVLRLTAGADARLHIDSSPFIVIAAAMVAVVILEELLFRGLLQHLLGRFGQFVAITATSTLYAAMYLNAGPLVGAAVMGVTGLVFSWIRARTGSLYGVMGAHVVLRAIVDW